MMENGKERNAAAHNQVDRFIKERGYVHDQEGMVPVKVLFADFREWQEEAGMAGLTFIDFETGIRGVTGSSRRYIETGGRKQFVIAGIRKGELSEDYISWMGIELPVIKTEGQIYVIMKQVVDSLGLHWDEEETEIVLSEYFDEVIFNIPSVIGIQRELCLPLEEFVRWFITIYPNGVLDDVREWVVSRQSICISMLSEQTEESQHEIAKQDQQADDLANGLQPQKVDFMGLGLPVVDIDDRAYVVMDMVLEIWDLTHPEFRRQILAAETLDDITVTVKTISGPQDQLCIPFTQFSQWLRTVDVETVRPGIREIVMYHQDICYSTLQEEQMIRAGSKMDEHPEIESEMKEENKMQEPEIDQAVTAETHTPEAVEFMGKQLLGVKVDDQVYVPMKPVVDGMGVAWQPQHAKIRETKRYNDIVIPLQTPGGPQKMLCIPLTKLNGWLFSINPEKVHPDLREKVVAYQDECFLALYNYFNKGAAINQDMLTEEKKEEIVDAVKKAAPAQVEEEPREGSIMKDEQVETMLMEVARKEGTADQVKQALGKIADTVNYSQFFVRTDCDHFRFDEKAMFQLVYQALQNLDDPLSPKSIKAFRASYCIAARYMIPRLAQGIIHHMQVEGFLAKGC